MNLSKFDGLNGMNIQAILLELLEIKLFRPARDADERKYPSEKRKKLHAVRKRLNEEQYTLAHSEPVQLFCQLDKHLHSISGHELDCDLKELGLPTFCSLLTHMLESGRSKHFL